MILTIDILDETEQVTEQQQELVTKLLEFAAIQEKVTEGSEVSITFVDNERIHEINKEYRGIDRPTDVISFALEDYKDEVSLDIRMLGDIYISLDKAREQAMEFGHSFLREICFLTVHGILHLLGYDHIEKEDEEIMFKKQDEILNEFGIKK